jgi:hypothetical protein
LVPSLDEPFGLVALEALAVGSAVLASRAGALPEIIEDGHSGLLFEAASPASLASSIRRLLGDRELERRIRENARARASFFSLEKSVAGYWKLYNRAVLARSANPH